MHPNASVYDSAIYGRTFGDPAMRALWSDEARIRHYLVCPRGWLIGSLMVPRFSGHLC